MQTVFMAGYSCPVVAVRAWPFLGAYLKHPLASVSFKENELFMLFKIILVDGSQFLYSDVSSFHT